MNQKKIYEDWHAFQTRLKPELEKLYLLGVCPAINATVLPLIERKFVSKKVSTRAYFVRKIYDYIKECMHEKKYSSAKK